MGQRRLDRLPPKLVWRRSLTSGRPHDIQINVVTAHGTNFNSFAAGKVHDPLDSTGAPGFWDPGRSRSS